jgi:plastocyanin
MPKSIPCLACFALLIVAAFPVWAATVDVQIAGADGRPAINSVVALVAQGDETPKSLRLPAEAVVDQRHETFLPLVTIVRKGGRVIFTNNDTTMHQVYSFSSIKQFELEVDEGHRSEPVVFDKPGVASIGCNIHDHMITYVYVADTPWAVLTDSTGRALLTDVPDGNYRVNVWHPQLIPGRPPPSPMLKVSGSTKLALTIPLLAVAPAKHVHMGAY